jgi:hypothetical protein
MVRLGPAAIFRELGVRYPAFGFPYPPDVIVAEAEERLAGKHYSIELMLPAGVPQLVDIDSLLEALPSGLVAFVEGLRERFDLAAPTTRVIP